jgi:hypothetical protein
MPLDRIAHLFYSYGAFASSRAATDCDERHTGRSGPCLFGWLSGSRQVR